MSQAYKTFDFIKKHYVESLNVTVEVYQHKITGAMHYHLANDDEHKVFMVALRTLPQDSTGVAHILEHTVLCGSEKYPVRDPFFMMIRRSINSFMNAFTSSDWTAYPFATENSKDFQNLLEVYMDAVFFPNIHELDFAQEGHRFEFETMDDPSSDLTYKGVVFNEMKGAMSSPISTLWQAVTTELFSDTTYHFNSGGEPVDIPNLTHEQLVEFHKTHYHPSNSVFMTYGNQTAESLQQEFEELALAKFTEKTQPIFVGEETPLTQPKIVEQSYALDEEDTENKTHIVLAWLLGSNQNPRDVLKGHLLSSVLLDNSSSPLRKLLETTDLAKAPSPLCGLEDSNKRMAFVVGVQGSEADKAQAVEDLILTELEKLAQVGGVDQEQVEAMLHQLELNQRELGGDSYPYGLELMLAALPAALHQGDPLALLDIDSVLVELQEEIKSPDFIPNLVKEWLLDNTHRVRLTLKPDTQMSAAKEAAEKQLLAETQAKLTDTEKQKIVEQALALAERQAQEDDPEILPKVTKEDIKPEVKTLEATDKTSKVTGYLTGTNGLVYQSLIMPLPNLTAEEQALMPLFNGCLTKVGSSSRDYLSTQALQAAVTGGIRSSSAVVADLADKDLYQSRFVVSGKALNRNQDKLTQLMEETLTQPNFSELQRLRELVSQVRSSMDHRVTGAGHQLAMSAAVQNFSAAANWGFNRSGFAGIKFIKELDKSLDNPDKLQEFASNLEQIASKMAQMPRQGLVIADEQSYQASLDSFSKLIDTEAQPNSFEVAVNKQDSNQAWITSTQVNFCAQAHKAVGWEHPDAAILSLVAVTLRNGFLHSAIREKGGAYGGGATYNASAGGLVFFSYRDPRLMDTFADFNNALDWLMTSAKPEQVDEAILNVISGMDKPGSPAGEARKAFYLDLDGKTAALRQQKREALLNADLEQLRSVAEKYLANPPTCAVLTQANQVEILENQGFAIEHL